MIIGPEQLIKKISGIERIYKITFWSAIFIGLIAHGYMFTNKLPNYDDLLCLNGFGGSFTFGRWFLGLLGVAKGRVVGNYSTPLFNGVLALILLALSACFVMAIFQNKSEIAGIIVAGLVVTFPTITGCFLFMFTSVFYALAIFLTALGVYFWSGGGAKKKMD